MVQVMDAVYDLLRATYDLRPSLSFSLSLLVLSFLSLLFTLLCAIVIVKTAT